MRLKLLWLAGLVAVLIGPANSWPQPPGSSDPRGFSGRPGYSNDRNERFSRYSGGSDVWVRPDPNDREGLRRFEEMAQQMGITGGMITRQDYLNYHQQREERFRSMRPDSPGGMFVNPTGGPTSSATPTGAPGDSRGRSGFGPSGSWGDGMFRRYDRNGDGVLSNDEIPDTLRNERDSWDANHDGFIDASEYLRYFEGYMQQRQAERASNQPGSSSPNGNGSRGFGNGPGGRSPSGPDGGGLMSTGRGQMPPMEFSFPSFDPSMIRAPERSSGGGTPSRTQPEEPQRPVVYRPGNLPKGLPSWFEQRDRDGDGQVGLYEWRQSGDALDEFLRIDSNNDGLVTAEEALRYQSANGQLPAENSVASAGNRNNNNNSNSGNNNGFSTPVIIRSGERTPDLSNIRDFAEMVPAEQREKMMEMMRALGAARGGDWQGRGGDWPGMRRPQGPGSSGFGPRDSTPGKPSPSGPGSRGRRPGGG
jgi:EF hand